MESFFVVAAMPGFYRAGRFASLQHNRGLMRYHEFLPGTGMTQG
jgi:hypothetical protein